MKLIYFLVAYVFRVLPKRTGHQMQSKDEYEYEYPKVINQKVTDSILRENLKLINKKYKTKHRGEKNV